MAHLEACHYCSGPLETVLDMGNQPLVNDYVSEPGPVSTFPLRLCRCSRCSLVQLDYHLPSEVLFPEDYPYTTGTTGALAKNARELALEVENALPYKGKLVVDIGSNDGTVLGQFKERGAKVCGVTPESAGKLARDRGVPTVQDYWGPGARADVEKSFGKATVVTALNVLAHVPDPLAFIREVGELMAPGALFVSDSHYLGTLLGGVQLDTVYHEHLRYYSVETVSRLLKEAGLEVAAVRRTPVHGGSIRVYARKPGGPQVNLREPYEEDPKAVSKEACVDFAQRARAARNRLRAQIAGAPGSPRIHGLGAPSRASTLLNYCGLTATDVPVTYEVAGSLKIGKRMPGSGVLVLDERDLATAKPDYLLLLSWHVSHDLIPKLRHGGYRGKFILPLPVCRIE